MTMTRRHRKRRQPVDTAPSSSPTTAPSWLSSRSTRPAGSSRRDATRSSSPSGNRSTSGSCQPSRFAINAAEIAEVREAAERTAADGASLAKAAGFKAHGLEIEVAPTWKGIVHAADEHDASLIVLGSHGRTGLAGVLLGSVAEAVAAHSRRSVLIIHRRG